MTIHAMSGSSAGCPEREEVWIRSLLLHPFPKKKNSNNPNPVL